MSASAADYIPVFISPAPGSSVRFHELFTACVALYREEGGTEYTRMVPFTEAVTAVGYRVVGHRAGRVTTIRDAAWNDPALAAEAEAARIAANAQRTNSTN